MTERQWEAILWSVALPGFGQLLNHQFLKGALFIFLEFLINSQSHFNDSIRFSFLGEIEKAVQVTNYQWLMFYPCLYFFAMWDCFKQAGTPPSYSFLPFVCCAYSVTTGLMYAEKGTAIGRTMGPVWFPMLMVLPGLLAGLLIRWIIMRIVRKKSS